MSWSEASETDLVRARPGALGSSARVARTLGLLAASIPG